MLTGYKDKYGKTMPLRGELKQLGRGGVGVELFFRTQRWLFVLFGASFIITIPCLVDNARWASTGDTSQAALGGTTLGLRDDGEYDGTVEDRLNNYQQLPWLLLTVVWLVFIYFVRYKQRSVARSVDLRNLTSGDYTVEVRGLPPSNTSPEQELADLKTFFAQFGEVAHVAVGYKCAAYVSLLSQWEKKDVERTEKKAAMSERLARGEQDDGSRVAEVESDMEHLQDAMRSMQAEPLVSTGAVFVVFNFEAGRRECLSRLRADTWRYMMEAMGLHFCLPGFQPLPRFKGYALEVQPAPEPSDVYWENLEVGPEQVRIRSLRTLVLAAVVICFTAGMLTLFSLERSRRVEQLTASNDANGVIYATGITLGSAAIVTLLNLALKMLVIYLTRFERHDTRTDHEESVFVKLSLAYVINQSLLVIFVSSFDTPEGRPQDSWFTPGGAFEQAFFICLANMVVPEVAKVLRVDMLLKRFILAPLARSQTKVEELLMPPEATIGEFYAGLSKTVALGLIYGPAMPLAFLVCTVTMAISYAANKVALLRVYKPPPVINEGLSEKFRWVLATLVLASIVMQYALVGQYVSITAVRGQYVSITAVSFFIFVVYVAVPLRWLPCLRQYVDMKSDDTGGQAFNTARGLELYACPITTKPPSIHDELHVSVVDDASDVGGGAPPPRPVPFQGPGSGALQPQGSAGREMQQVYVQPPGLGSGRWTGVGPSQGGGPQPGLHPESYHPASVSASHGGSGGSLYGPSAPAPPMMQEEQYIQPYPPQPAPPPVPLPGPGLPPPGGPPYVHAQVMPPQLLAVRCPMNAGPGAQILVQAPSGQLVSVVVPVTVLPGQTFHVSV